MRRKKSKKARNSVMLYFHYIKVIIQSAMEYKASFLLGAIGQVLVSLNGLLGIYFIFARFHIIQGYTLNEALLCYGMMLLGFSIAQCVARGFESFSQLIKSGGYDRIMVRPRSPILQVLGSKFETNRILRILLALGCFFMEPHTVRFIGRQIKLPQLFL